MNLVRPRLTDHHGIHKSQADLDFVIPFYVDRFLLCSSPSMAGSVTVYGNYQFVQLPKLYGKKSA